MLVETLKKRRRREKGEGRREKGEGRREKDEGGRKKEEGREGSCFHTICSQMNDDIEVFELSLHSLLIRKVQLLY